MNDLSRPSTALVIQPLCLLFGPHVNGFGCESKRIANIVGSTRQLYFTTVTFITRGQGSFHWRFQHGLISIFDSDLHGVLLSCGRNHRECKLEIRSVGRSFLNAYRVLYKTTSNACTPLFFPKNPYGVLIRQQNNRRVRKIVFTARLVVFFKLVISLVLSKYFS